MFCRYCGHSKSKVIRSRFIKKFLYLRRRRQCLNCGSFFTTKEIPTETLDNLNKTVKQLDAIKAGLLLSFKEAGLNDEETFQKEFERLLTKGKRIRFLKPKTKRKTK